MSQQKGLGRGLGALIGSQLASPQPSAEKGEVVQKVPLGQIVPSPFQPRKVFHPEQLSELVESIRERGVIQPLIVRLVNGKHELIAGERRWRASQQVGLAEVPVIVRSASDREVLELALVENLQRADLNPIEEAEGYALLINQFRLTQEQVAQRVGKSRVNVANAVRLLGLADEVRGWVSQNRLSVGHAKVILGLPSKDEQILVAHRVVKDGLTVRQTEKLVDSLPGRTRKPKGAKGPGVSEAAWTDLEKRIQRALGTRVRMHGNGEVGKIEIEYFSASELEQLLARFGVSE
ncbi:MAG: ParB/RepB/Spo0J family partition protein [Verrucomicrobium sp.]|nr:ParB/RepB/Spo0J family partition protein [Verrucomicrobium sp.]